MRKINEVLRLRFELKRSHRQIARSIGAASSTVAEYLRRFAEAGLSWPLSAGLSEAELEAKLFPPAPGVPAAERLEPDWAALHAEMRRPGVTLMLLWQEYRAGHPQGFAYSWFCEHYRAWVGRLDLVMRQEHRAGEKLFVDFAGQTVPITDRDTGELRPASIFVAVLGASNYTYAEATWGEGLLSCHRPLPEEKGADGSGLSRAAGPVLERLDCLQNQRSFCRDRIAVESVIGMRWNR